MADVRSLLRQERAQRQQAQRSQKVSAPPAAAPTSKKRKAADDGAEERKRTRTEESAGVPAGFFDPGAVVDEENTAQPSDIDVSDHQPAEAPKASNPPLDAAEEADLDAFLDEMNRAPAPESRLPTAFSGAVIEAAPMSAAEIAAQVREEQSAQKARRDEEMEGEKEDAARALEDEFEEMDGLEERVRKLREQREALRTKHMGLAKAEEIVLSPQQSEDAEMSDDSDDEDWDDWRFRPA